MTREKGAWRAGLLAILLLAVVIRLPALTGLTMWHDEAVEGLMSQDVLRGRFPVFFYGQPVHGVPDRYLAALVVGLLGPTPLALKLAALALYLVFLSSFAYTNRQVFGGRVAGIASVLVAVPPLYLYGWSLDSRTHYMVMLILGTWLLFLAWRIARDGVAESPPRRFVGLGLMAGVAWWTNYLSLSFLAPIAVALGLGALVGLPRRWRAALARGALAGAAFALGVAPLVIYYASHRLPLMPPGQVVGEERFEAHLSVLLTGALPWLLGVATEVWGSAAGAATLAIAALMLIALLYSAWRWLSTRRQPGGSGDAIGLLLGVVLVTLALSLGTQYGAILRYPRYLLPIYLALPVFLALAVERLAPARPALRFSLVAVVAAHNLLGSLTLTPVLAKPSPLNRPGWLAAAHAEVAFLERHGIRHVYSANNHWSFLSDRRVIVSDPYQERMADVALAVDATERLGWVFNVRSAAFEDSLAAAGVDFRILSSDDSVVYTDFQAPRTRYADLEPLGWTATASHEGDAAARAFDRDVDSVWRTRAAQAPGHFYQLDLGRVERIGRVAWLPWRFTEVPLGFSLSVSLDGRGWRTVARAPRYFGPLYWSGAHPFQRIRRGRVEVRFEPTEARHLRVELLASGSPVSWSIRELFVGTPVAECTGRGDPAELARFLIGAGVDFAHADHWLSAALGHLSDRRIGVLPSNKSVNSYRLERPSLEEIERVRLRDRAIVVDACPDQQGEAIAALLADSGVGFRRTAVAGYVAFTDLLRPDDPSHPAALRAAGAERIAVSLPEPRTATRLLIECGQGRPAPQRAADLDLFTSRDGTSFAATPFRLVVPGRLRMSGPWLFRDPPERPDRMLVLFEPRALSAARLARRGGWQGCAPAAAFVG